jgi:hypothetical protein
MSLSGPDPTQRVNAFFEHLDLVGGLLLIALVADMKKWRAW